MCYRYLHLILSRSGNGIDIRWHALAESVSVLNKLTHWGRVTHICVSKLNNIGSDNIWNNSRLLLIGPLGANFSEIFIEINTFLFKKMHLRISSGQFRLFYLSLNECVKLRLAVQHFYTLILHSRKRIDFWLDRDHFIVYSWYSHSQGKRCNTVDGASTWFKDDFFDILKIQCNMFCGQWYLGGLDKPLAWALKCLLAT